MTNCKCCSHLPGIPCEASTASPVDSPTREAGDGSSSAQSHSAHPTYVLKKNTTVCVARIYTYIYVYIYLFMYLFMYLLIIYLFI
jgi:hypothetical protein